MLCRICLTDVTPLIGIFSEDGMNHQVADKIKICLQLQIQKDDCFPDKVCCKCFMTVNEFFAFWIKARESYRLLQKLQKDVALKQSVTWTDADTENEDVVIEPTPDLLDIIDMETTTGKRKIADILKQPGNCDYMSNYTGKRESTFPLLPAAINYGGNFPSNMSKNNTLSRHLQYCDSAYSKPTVQPTHGTKTWKHISEEHPVQQEPQTKINEQHLDSKPNQFVSKHFSFGRPSMTFDFSKEAQENCINSWEKFHTEKPESKPHILEKEKQHESISNSFSFSMKYNSKDVNSPCEHKTDNSGSQPIFSSNDEYSLPNIPLSLFSSSNDKKQTSFHSKTPMETKNTENLLPQSPIIGTSKVSSFSQNPNDIEMTPRSKVMKMLNREMW